MESLAEAKARVIEEFSMYDEWLDKYEYLIELGKNLEDYPEEDKTDDPTEAGGEEGSGTRSSLLWECQKAIQAKRPKFLLLENVPALVSEKFKPLFKRWCKTLEALGYTNHWKCLNAKHYGVPQNRNRVFLVSIYADTHLLAITSPNHSN